MNSDPFPLAIVVCDGLHRDPSTGKYTLLGTFSSLGATQFPTVHPQFAVFVAFSDIEGDFKFELRFVLESDEETVIQAVGGEAHCTDRLAVVEIGVQFQGIPIPQPGEYRMQCLIDGSILNERRIVVIGPPPTEEVSDE